MYNLVVVAILKNESHIIREWIEHYIYHGVEHFYLIDNDSDDDPRARVKDYDSNISWLNFHGQGCQQKAYDAIFPQINARWTLVTDLDEFVYAPEGWSIPWVLESFRGYSGIAIPWIMFGSSDYIEQPVSVVSSFTWRLKTTKPHNVLTKTIANMVHCRGFGVHKHLYTATPNCILSNNQPIIGEGFADINEQTLDQYTLLLNHYPIQSRNFFQQVKMTRGDSARLDGKNVRNMNYFNAYNYHDIEDERLKNINERRTYASPCI